mmetsp:Transcript_100204/g.188850  ORF Transcript_100204/g.188850 Transcript_100204/m.188850 type:complete len:701 (+) Transcript_100204:129-2231(+)
MGDEDNHDNFNPEVGPKELEVLIAEMETRLRRAILKIIRPTLDQAAELSSRIADLQRKVEKHDGMLNTTDQLKEEVAKQVQLIQLMGEQIRSCDAQAKAFEHHAGEQLYELRTRLVQVEQRGEEHEGELRKVNRDFQRVWSEIERLQKQHDTDASNIWQGINNGFKKTEKARDELLERIGEAQKQHFDAMEEIFGEGKGITKINNEIHQLFDLVEPVPKVERMVEEVTAMANRIDQRQEICDEFCNEQKQSFIEMKTSVNDRLTSFAEDNNDCMNKLTAYHASILRNVRIEFAEEIGLSRQLREEICKFESQTKDLCEQVNQALADEIARVDALHRELVMDVDDVNQRRKKDRVFLEGAVRSVASEVLTTQECADSLSCGVEHLSKVMGLVLEGERVANALQIQDFADRRAERWLGPPADLQQKAQPTCTAASLEKLDRGRDRSNPEELAIMVPVEPRVGLAKLQYKPGPVSVGSRVYDRQDVLLLHSRLLEKAKSALERGPEFKPPPRDKPLEPEASSASIVAMQPGANGGMGGSDIQVPLKIDGKSGEGFGDLEDPKLSAELPRNSTASSGQRPGSQHQPQAMGSRSGPLTAPLGPTHPADARSKRRLEPGSPRRQQDQQFPPGMEGSNKFITHPENPPALRLPAINGASGAAAAPGPAATPMSLQGGMTFSPLALGNKKIRAKAVARPGENKSLSAR